MHFFPKVFYCYKCDLCKLEPLKPTEWILYFNSATKKPNFTVKINLEKGG